MRKTTEHGGLLEIDGGPITLLPPPERIGEEEQIDGSVRERPLMGHWRPSASPRPAPATIDVSVTVSPVKDRAGQIIGASKIVRDITQRKQAQEALHRAKEEWEQTFHSVPDLIAILDHKHRVVRVNQPMAKRLGREPEECVGLRASRPSTGRNASPGFLPPCPDPGRRTRSIPPKCTRSSWAAISW